MYFVTILLLLFSVFIANFLSLGLSIDKEITSKCNPGENQMEIGMKCAKEVTGIESAEDMVKALSDDETKLRFISCIFEELGILDEDGFNLKNAEKAVDEMKADDATKTKLKENLRSCSDGKDKDADLEAILLCLVEENQDICGAN